MQWFANLTEEHVKCLNGLLFTGKNKLNLDFNVHVYHCVPSHSAPGLFYCETAVVMAAACGLAFAEIC